MSESDYIAVDNLKILIAQFNIAIILFSDLFQSSITFSFLDLTTESYHFQIIYTIPLIQVTEQTLSLQIHECHYCLYGCCEYPPGAYGAGGGGSGV